MDPETFKAVVLNAAIQGKLVPQDPNDEPASVLIERIREERQKMVKEGKIKKDKCDSFIFKRDNHYYENKAGHDSELEKIPFDIPESWTWVRISSISELTNGLASRGTKDGEETYVIRLANLSSGSIDYSKVRKIKLSPGDIRNGYCTLGDIIIIRVNGSRNRVADPFEFVSKEPMCFCDHLIRVRVNSAIIPSYLCLIMKTPYFKELISPLIVTSSGQNTISQSSIKNSLIPLPPLNEQERIVNSYKQCLSLSTTHEEMRASLSSISAHLRQSILFYSIQGKLVPQDPNDSPADIQCKNPIIRRDNSYYESNILVNTPFEIPKSWKWVRGVDLFERQRTATIQTDSFTYVDIDSIDNHKCIIATPKTIKAENTPSRAKRQIKEGDVLFSLVRPYLKNIAQVTNQYSTSIASTGFFVCRSRYYDSDFLYYLMTSKYVVDGINEKMKGDNSPSVKKEDLLQFLYPLPPINEQKRIVCKLKLLIKLADMLVWTT